MAKAVTSGQLKATLAQALDLPDRRIAYPHRVAQEGGEISRGKRGKGGAEVTVRDAGTMIVAVASSYLSDEVIKGIREINAATLGHTAHIIYRPNPNGPTGHLHSEEGWTEVDGGPWQLLGFSLPQLQSLPVGHTFSDAMAALIEAARDGAFEKAIAKAFPHETFTMPFLDVTFSGPDPVVSIKIRLIAGHHSYEETAVYHRSAREEVVAPRESSGFEVSVSLNHQVLYAVASLFREHAE